ncbi:MAG: major capsid protein, partial [Gammaproteobacteria bacterium]
EGNLPTGHRTTIRTGLPTPTWRKLYGGVQPTKSRTVQVTDSCGMLEAYAEVDKALADLNGNTAAFRLSEDMAHIEGMNQEFASTLIYGNEGSEPEAFTGLAARFNDQAALNGENIITSAATPDANDNTSIWLVGWGANTVHGIYPKGSIGGIQMEDKGQVTIESIDGAGGRMEAYR